MKRVLLFAPLILAVGCGSSESQPAGSASPAASTAPAPVQQSSSTNLDPSASGSNPTASDTIKNIDGSTPPPGMSPKADPSKP